MADTNTRRIKFPKPCLPTVGGTALGGLVEWLIQSLTARGVLDTLDGCELVQAVLPRLLELQGGEQEGKTLDVTEPQWGLLKEFGKSPTGLPPDVQLPLSACLVALYTALVVPPEDKKVA